MKRAKSNMTEKAQYRCDDLHYLIKGCEPDLNPKQPDTKADTPYYN